MTGRRPGARRRVAARAPAPPARAMRLLGVATGVAILLGFASAVTTLTGADPAAASTPAAGGGSTAPAMITSWFRLGIAVVVAVLWPLLLFRLRRGNPRIYPRIRNVSVAIAAMLVLVTITSTESVWSHAAQCVQAAALLGVFAATLHPDLRDWYLHYR